MLSNSIIQIAVYFILVTAISVPLGLYMAKVFSREHTFLDRVLTPIESLIYRICGINPDVEMGWAAIRDFDARIQLDLDDLPVRVAAAAVLPAAQSAGTRGRAAGAGLQHCGQLHDQHQLAGVLGRADAELPDADGRADVAQFSVGGGRNRDGGGGDSRFCAPQRNDDRQLLGRSYAHDAVGADADLADLRAGARVAGCAGQLQSVRQCDDARGRYADRSPKDRSRLRK